MPTVDFNEAIEALVAAEVERQLAPYREVLSHAATVFRMPLQDSAKAARASAPARRKGPGRRPSAARGDVSKFSVGQAVRYRQGRGEFDATVSEIDSEANALVLERAKDGKKVRRPAGKVYLAA